MITRLGKQPTVAPGLLWGDRAHAFDVDWHLGLTFGKYDGRTISPKPKRITHHVVDFKPLFKAELRLNAGFGN
jgi:hypothetical protein